MDGRTTLTRGAKRQRVISVPAIRVGAGGRRPRRTSQLALSRRSEHARGFGLSKIRNPLTPPLSPTGRGSRPSLQSALFQIHRNML